MFSRLSVSEDLNLLWALVILTGSLSCNSYDISDKAIARTPEQLCSKDTLAGIMCPVGTSPRFLYSEDDKQLCEDQMESDEIYCIEMSTSASCQIGCVPDEDQCGPNGIQSISAEGIICKESSCTPNMQVRCSCLDDTSGYQVCNDDGTRFGECMCDSP